jgi:uncharacterized membrane protein YgdD (TMEM256/DUF423 family)
MKRVFDTLGGLAGGMGGAGVALAAAAAHGGGGDFGRLAAQFLILHAAATLGIGAHARGASARRATRLLICGATMGLGALLFCADLALVGFKGVRLFPFAAPMGGSLMILSWAALAVVFALPE